MILVCLHGAPGVGKLTVGRQLQQATGFILIHDHMTIETAAAVSPFGTPDFSRLRSSLVAILLHGACSTGRGVIVTHADDVFWNPGFDSIVRQSQERHGYRVARAFLQCGAKEHEARISDPGRAQYRKISDIGRLRRLTNAGEFVPREPSVGDVVVDTTSMSPLEVADWLTDAFELVRGPAAQLA